MIGRIGIGFLSYGFIHPAIYINHMRVVSKWSKKFSLALIHVDGVKCAQARNICVDQAMKNVCTHLLFIDNDHIVPDDALESLVSVNTTVVSALICKRKPPFPQVGYIFAGGGYRAVEIDPREKTIVDVDICAMGCTLIDMKIFDELDRPFFLDVEGMLGDGFSTFNKRHDVNFFERVRTLGGKVKIDARTQWGHVGDNYVPFPIRHIPQRHLDEDTEKEKKEAEVKK